MSMMGMYQIKVDTTDVTLGHSLAAYLTSASDAILTSSTIGAKEYLDSADVASHLDSSAYATGVDYLSSMGVVDDSGNWVPITLNAAGEIPVAASINMTADYAEDSPHVSSDIGLFNLAVRRDARTSGTSADGDYASFNVNASGEMWVKDADVLARLVLVNTDTTAILADTATIDSQTLSIQNTLTALSKAEDAAHGSGDQGVQALAVRKDAQGTNTSADGDYSSLLTWSEGSLKVVDVSNASVLQQQVTVTTTATQFPVSNLANRKMLMIQNTGSSKVWLGSATLTSTGAASGIELPANSLMELEVGPAVNVFFKTNAGTGQLNLLETA